jgi:bisphosphoglycerate-independent phosphoglycerate mutase (AlkP superfamily)
VVGKNLKSNKFLPKGALADVAPTILKLIDIHVPENMTGKDLFQNAPVISTLLGNN